MGEKGIISSIPDTLLMKKRRDSRKASPPFLWQRANKRDQFYLESFLLMAIVLTAICCHKTSFGLYFSVEDR